MSELMDIPKSLLEGKPNIYSIFLEAAVTVPIAFESIRVSMTQDRL